MRRRAAALLLVLAATGCGGSGTHPRLTATPATALVDRTIHVRLTGASPGARVTISAHWSAWSSRGVYRADARGTIDLERDRSTGGSYRGRDPMGLFWSMSGPQHSGSGRPLPPVRLEARSGGRVLASTRVRWRSEADGVRERETTLARDGFLGRYYVPKRSNGIPILVFGGSGGGFIGIEAPLLASHGFPTLSLAYFGAPGLPQSLSDIPLEYFVRAIRWLDRQPGVDPTRLVVSGVSRGSEPAMLLGVHFPKLVHGVVALVPTSIVHGALGSDPSRPAWLLHEVPIEAGTRIPVEEIPSPILVAGGVEDSLWPSALYVRDLLAHLHGRKDVTALTYARAGHNLGLAVPNLPELNVVETRYGRLNLGGSKAADAHARADLWQKLLRFLRGV